MSLVTEPPVLFTRTNWAKTSVPLAIKNFFYQYQNLQGTVQCDILLTSTPDPLQKWRLDFNNQSYTASRVLHTSVSEWSISAVQVWQCLCLNAFWVSSCSLFSAPTSSSVTQNQGYKNPSQKICNHPFFLDVNCCINYSLFQLCGIDHHPKSPFVYFRGCCVNTCRYQQYTEENWTTDCWKLPAEDDQTQKTKLLLQAFLFWSSVFLELMTNPVRKAVSEVTKYISTSLDKSYMALRQN